MCSSAPRPPREMVWTTSSPRRPSASTNRGSTRDTGSRSQPVVSSVDTTRVPVSHGLPTDNPGGPLTFHGRRTDLTRR